MFEELVGSGARRAAQPMRGLVVAALHGLVIAGAVQATMGAPSPPSVRVDGTVFVVPPASTPAPLVAAPTSGPLTGPTLPAELILPPVDLPSGLPPIVPGPAIDPALLRRIAGVGRPGPARGDSAAGTAILAAAQVDEPAVAIYQPSPRYPPVLQQAGVEGRVTVEFVIDTLGRVESGSFRVVESSHAGFEAAALETVQRSRFRPARVRGSVVRQRTIQGVAFRIAAP